MKAWPCENFLSYWLSILNWNSIVSCINAKRTIPWMLHDILWIHDVLLLHDTIWLHEWCCMVTQYLLITWYFIIHVQIGFHYTYWVIAYHSWWLLKFVSFKLKFFSVIMYKHPSLCSASVDVYCEIKVNLQTNTHWTDISER